MDRCCSSLLCLGCVRLFVGWFDMRRLCLVVVIVLGVVLRCGGLLISLVWTWLGLIWCSRSVWIWFGLGWLFAYFDFELLVISV